MLPSLRNLSTILLLSSVLPSVLSVSSFRSYKPICNPLKLPPHVAGPLKLNNLRQFCVTGAEFVGTTGATGNLRWQPPAVQCECDPLLDLGRGQIALSSQPPLKCTPRYNTLQHLPDKPNAYANHLLDAFPHLFDGRVCKEACQCPLAPHESEETTAEKIANLQAQSSSLSQQQRQRSSGSLSQRLFQSFRGISQRGSRGTQAAAEETARLCEGTPCSTQSQCAEPRARPACSTRPISCVARSARGPPSDTSGSRGTAGRVMRGVCMSIDTFSPEYRSPLQRFIDEGELMKRDGFGEVGPDCLCNATFASTECCFASDGVVHLGLVTVDSTDDGNGTADLS